jgi:hypothetical protein
LCVHIEDVGKRQRHKSGKHRVNKNDEETFQQGKNCGEDSDAVATRSADVPTSDNYVISVK